MGLRLEGVDKDLLFLDEFTLEPGAIAMQKIEAALDRTCIGQCVH
jgi:hypothetical protein